MSALNERSCRIICMWPQNNYFVFLFFIVAQMGSCFSFLNEPNVEIIDETWKGKQFDHFRP